MKSFLFSIPFLLIPKLAISQITANDRTIYLDSIGNETNQEQHYSYRIVKDYYSVQKEYKIYEYYKSNKLKNECTRTGRDGDGHYIGDYISYYENGNKEDISHYENGKQKGKYLSYHKNGILGEEGEYTGNPQNEKDYILHQLWDENNNHLVIDGNGTASYVDKDLQARVTFKNGFKDGVFEAKNLKDNSSIVEKYNKGKFISGIRTYPDNTKKEYFEIEKRPHPKNGMHDFYTFIGRNFKQADNNISGKILVQFMVDTEGQIVEPTILRGLGYELDSEAIRVLLKYGNWIPGEKRGEKVKSKFIIPITLQSFN